MIKGVDKGSRAITNRATRVWGLALLFLLLTLLLFLLFPPIEQDPAYHQFADHRQFLFIPNTINVLSTLPLLWVGVVGVRLLLKQPRTAQTNQLHLGYYLSYLTFFSGIVLSAIGSSFYHLAPTNDTLLWDRLAMSVAFTGFFSSVVAHQLSARWAVRVLLLILPLAVFSVINWWLGEQSGQGDLRLYALVQFFPLLFIPLLLVLFPADKQYLLVIAWVIFYYVVAKVLEWQDSLVYSLGYLISGHSLKHLIVAIAGYLLYRYLRDQLLRTSTVSEQR